MHSLLIRYIPLIDFVFVLKRISRISNAYFSKPKAGERLGARRSASVLTFDNISSLQSGAFAMLGLLALVMQQLLDEPAAAQAPHTLTHEPV